MKVLGLLPIALALAGCDGWDEGKVAKWRSTVDDFAVRVGMIAAPTRVVCGDGLCDPSETTTCARDCACGNGRCEEGETPTTCGVDCAPVFHVRAGAIAGDGSKESPFGSLRQGLEKAAQAGAVSVSLRAACGTYGEAVKLSRSTFIVGESQKCTFLVGKILGTGAHFLHMQDLALQKSAEQRTRGDVQRAFTRLVRVKFGTPTVLHASMVRPPRG